MKTKKKTKKSEPLWPDRKKSPYRADSGVANFHLNMRFYQVEVPKKQKKTLEELSEDLMADIRKACEKHGLLYSGTHHIVREDA